MNKLILTALILASLPLTPALAAPYDDMPYVKQSIALTEKQITLEREATALLSRVKDKASADAAAAALSINRKAHYKLDEEQLFLGKPSHMEYEALEAHESSAQLEEALNLLQAQTERIRKAKPSCYGSRALKKLLQNM